MKRILFVLAFLCISLEAAGTTYYVRQNGNDNASGTSWATAWRTVNKVNQSVSGGDSVVFGSGAFCGYTLDAAGGTEQAPTYYTCSSLVAMPTISPGDSLTDSSWVSLGSGDYRTVMSTWNNTDLAFIWVDGNFLLRVHSRTPGDGQFGLYNDTLYLDPPGTLSPSLRSVWGLKAAVGVDMAGARYTNFYGLRICAVYRAAFYHQHLYGATNVTIRNCVMEYGATHTGYNGAFIFSNRASTGAPKDWRVVKNTFGECIAIGNNADLEDGGGITDWEFPSVNSAAIMLYSAHRWVIDSNQFNGGGYWGNIDFKAAYEDNQEETVDSVLLAYNWFNENRISGISIRFYGTYRHIYTICNIFRDTTETNISSATGAGAIQIETGSSPAQNGGASYFYNNTFYQPSENFGTTTFPSGIADGIFWKYNLITPRGINTAGLNFPVSTSAPELWLADSNQYYSPIGYNFRIAGSSRTWSQWQAEGYDVHSVRLDPQYASPGVDFTPANAQPVARTFVQSWWPYSITVGQYGAVQNTGDPCFGSLIWSRPAQGSAIVNESVRWLVEGKFSFPVDSFRLGFDVTKLRAGGSDGGFPYHLMDVDSVTFTGSLGAAAGANTLVCSPTGYPDSFVVKIIPSNPIPPDSGLLFSVWTTPVQTGTMPLQILDNLSRSTCTGALDFAPTGFFDGNSLCRPSPIQLTVAVQSEQTASGRGDINLNSLPNEVSDALMFAKYFVQGMGIFSIDAAAQVAATDINADGYTLGASDLVYMIRIINGDTQPYDKLAPSTVQYRFESGALSVSRRLGAVHIVVGGNATPVLEADNLELMYQYHPQTDVTRLLVYSMSGDAIPEGRFISGLGNDVRSLEFSTFDGAPVTAMLAPGRFHLSQNYPNPFNPSTTISFELPQASSYTLTIVNIQGRVVRQFRGLAQPGVTEVVWDASDAASGVYFYRLSAGQHSAARKMLLLK